MKLLIVESPAKSKTIEHYLGEEFIVESSIGHIRDLTIKGKGSIQSEDFEDIETTIDTVIIENGITEIKKQDIERFTSLTKITLPKSLCILEEDVFSGFESLKTVECDGKWMKYFPIKSFTIPILVKRILKGEYNNWKLLEEIFIHPEVERIEDEAFANCVNLMCVYFYNNKKGAIRIAPFT